MTDLLSMLTEVKKVIYGDGYASDSEEKFNFAIIKKTISNITYEELWILSNAYYDYEVERFVKIDTTHNSFGIQIQANGSYPGEAELGYTDNVGINIWRNGKSSDVYKDTSTFDYTDFDENNYIGAKRKSNNKWEEFGVASGWNNSFMVDSYGGMTIGGAGFEVDGNGIFPYTRLTSSAYTDENDESWYLLGLLENAYHPTLYGWDCDKNDNYSWFVGLKTPNRQDAYLVKENAYAKFVVMYNDNSGLGANVDEHALDVGSWTTVFEVSTSEVRGIVNGSLTALGAGSSGGSSATLDDSDWQDLTLTGNFYNFDSSHKVQYRKYGNHVQIIGLPVLNANPAANSELIIGTLPSAFKPAHDMSFLCELKDDEKLWTCTVKTNGDVTFNRLRDNTGFVAGTAYADILKLNVQYLVG
ncbi:hypothetical protein [Methanobrevibacter sp.]|uniref:hypothetical protein n=1 Tax=Methanobrevibacter sp. TaxID=66852 RepID=UPI0038692AE3